MLVTALDALTAVCFLLAAATVFRRCSAEQSYRALLFCLALLGGLTVLAVVKWSVMRDVQVYCAAVQARSIGLSPYDTDSLRQFGTISNSFTYPLATLYLFRPLCIGPQKIFHLVGLVLLAVTFFVCRRGRSGSSFELIALLALGYAGTTWNFDTGNIGIIELALLAGSLAALERERIGRSAFLLGALSSFKILPLAFVGLFLLRKDVDKRRSITVLAMAVLPVAFIIALSFVISPAELHAFLEHLVSAKVGQHSPVRELTFNGSNPTLALLLVPAAMPSASAVVLAVSAVLCAVALALAVRFRSRLACSEFEFFCLAMLVLLVLLPRVKPYSFTFAIPPTYYLIRSARKSLQAQVLAVTCLLPSFAFWHCQHHPILAGVVQPLTVIATLVLVVQDRWRKGSASEARTPEADAVEAGRSGVATAR